MIAKEKNYNIEFIAATSLKRKLKSIETIL